MDILIFFCFLQRNLQHNRRLGVIRRIQSIVLGPTTINPRNPILLGKANPADARIIRHLDILNKHLIPRVLQNRNHPITAQIYHIIAKKTYF